jgi:hypothetical protein
MILRQELRNSIRLVLADTTHFPDASLNQHINDAIDDYSRFFTRTDMFGLFTTQGRDYYEISSSRQAVQVLRVEYPTGQAPPRYLMRMGREDPRFYGSPVYDWQVEDWAAGSLLYLGQPTEAGLTLTVTIETVHLKPASDISLLTVPDSHLEALRAFVVWKALQKLEVEDALRSTALLAEVSPIAGMTAERAEKVYRKIINELKRNQSAGGFTPSWEQGGRIY